MLLTLIITFIVFLVVAVTAVIAYPLFFQDLEPHQMEGLPNEIFSERDAMLEALSDLELSRGAGKLSDQDYQSEKTRLELKYIQAVESPSEHSS